VKIPQKVLNSILRHSRDIATVHRVSEGAACRAGGRFGGGFLGTMLGISRFTGWLSVVFEYILENMEYMELTYKLFFDFSFYNGFGF
jgi:hypothetical protein